MERLTKYKRSSLVGIFVSDEEKMFYSIDTRCEAPFLGWACLEEKKEKKSIKHELKNEFRQGNLPEREGSVQLTSLY